MNLGMTEMIFLVVLALLLFGPKKLPEIGRQIGKAMGEFKRASHEFQSQLNDEVRQFELETELKDLQNTISPPEGSTPRASKWRESGENGVMPDAEATANENLSTQASESGANGTSPDGATPADATKRDMNG
jgi:sec-independent protein translocase protein TatB